MTNWYPETLRVGPRGTPSTYEFMRAVFPADSHFSYAEFGIYHGDTARHVCELFPNATLFLFDFDANIEKARARLSGFPNRIHYFPNSQRYNDSYNWALAKLIASNSRGGLFDYCFLDGAHTFAVDALCFLLCDRLLRPGGYMDFDDYGWTLRGSSLDPAHVPQIAAQYSDEQIDTAQVKMIVETLVRPDPRYEEIVPKKIYQKVA
jgi:hypothetical protein